MVSLGFDVVSEGVVSVVKLEIVMLSVAVVSLVYPAVVEVTNSVGVPVEVSGVDE